jgi:hypothetical protein
MTWRGHERRERRRRDDDEPWTRRDQRAFEDGLREQMQGIREELGLARRQLAWLLGGLAVLAFLAPLGVSAAVGLLR